MAEQIYQDINDITLKCVLLGSPGTGKTSIMLQYISKKFTDSVPTIGAAYNSKTITTACGTTVKVDIWDTAGQERFNSLMPMYYRGANIVLVVYDITSYESYIRAKKWITGIKSEHIVQPIFVLVGNKCDLDCSRKVNNLEVNEYAEQNNLIFYECSAKTSYNIINIFNDAYDQAFQDVCKRMQKSKNNSNDQTIDIAKSNNLYGYVTYTLSCFGLFSR
jgi:Ras-related protein Rab-5C